MSWLIATLIGIAAIYFMIVSRGFRVVVMLAIGALVLGIFWWADNNQKQSAQDYAALNKERVESQKQRRNAVKTTALLLQDVWLEPFLTIGTARIGR
jgi:high-affinity Fe2+/Pb2+ permease